MEDEMKELFDAIWATAFTLMVATGGTYAVRKIGGEIRTAALTKAAHGLPPLASFSHRLTSRKSR